MLFVDVVPVEVASGHVAFAAAHASHAFFEPFKTWEIVGTVAFDLARDLFRAVGCVFPWHDWN